MQVGVSVEGREGGRAEGREGVRAEGREGVRAEGREGVRWSPKGRYLTVLRFAIKVVLAAQSRPSWNQARVLCNKATMSDGPIRA